MRLDKLTTRFQQALADAQSLALGRDHPSMAPAHLMLALLDQDGGSTQPLLLAAGINADPLRNRIMAALDRMATLSQPSGEIQMSSELGRLLNLTDKLAQKRKDPYVSSELFVLAAVDDKGELGEALRASGARKELLGRLSVPRFFGRT